MVQEPVNDAALRGYLDGRDPDGGPDSPGRFAGAETETACPRCRKPAPRAADECGHCGFSFRETRVRPADGGEAAAASSSEAAAGAFESRSLIGRTINGKYRVLGLLGEGGFGVVYRVEFLLFDEAKTFALKVLHPRLSANESFRRRFLREARLAMCLAHENAVQVREFGTTEEGLLYFTMDFCGGESLKSVLTRERVLSVPRALAVTRQILAVVKAAHDQGIVHRDLKPENIFLERDGRGRERVKVGDFGLAKTIQGPFSEDITHGGIVGSPRYMSPEQSSGGEIDGRSDLFSVGMILHELLYGTVPEDGDIECDPEGKAAPSFSVAASRVEDVPPEVDGVLRRALARGRAERFVSADQFLAALDALPLIAGRRPLRARLHDALRWAALGLVALCVLAVAPFHPTQSDGGPAPPGGSGDHTPAQSSGLEAVALDSTEAIRIEDFVPLAAGSVFEYLVETPQAGPGASRLRLEVLEERGRGRFRVRVDPDGHEFFWVVDRDDNSFRREYTLPDPETGEMSVGRSRTLLKLPVGLTEGWNGYRTSVGGEDVDVRVNTVGPFDVAGLTLDHSVQVIETDPERKRRNARYYQRRVGEVAAQVFDEDGELVYSRVLVLIRGGNADPAASRSAP